MDLTINQTNAINEIDKNLQIIACAGSGKTEVISRRIGKILSEKNVDPKSIVAFTFTEKAAKSLGERIKRVTDNKIDISQMYIGTIHGFCYKLLKDNCEQFKDFRVLDSVKNFLFVKRYFNDCGMTELGLNNYSFDIKLFFNCIDKLIYEYDNKELWGQNDRNVLDRYKKCLYEKKYFDFSLIIHETVNQIKEHPQLIDNYKYLIVDEYQDIDDLQEQLISYFEQTGCNICVVGDDDQTIYRFRR